MKIALVCPYKIVERTGGVQVHIEELAKEYRHLGHIAKIISPRVDGYINKDPNLIFVGKPKSLDFNKTSLEVTSIPKNELNELKILLAKENFDIYHFHEPEMPYMPAELLPLIDKPAIGTFHAAPTMFHNMQIVKSVYHELVRYICSMLSGVTAVSDVPGDNLRKILKINEPIKLIPNGISLKRFNPNLKPIEKYKDGKINILFMGRLDKRKGVKYLIKAFKKIRRSNENVRLIIGGSGSEMKNLRNYVKNNRIPDVEILGFVDEKIKPRYYATCDIFCSPAISGESFGIVLVEAMACGKPVIGGDNEGYACVLKGLGSFLLVDPKKTKDFVNILNLLIKDKYSREVFGKWGIDESKQYSWKNVAKQMLEFYQDTLDAKTFSYKYENENDEKFYQRFKNILKTILGN